MDKEIKEGSQTIYGSAKPPPNKEMAQTRLSELRDVLVQIEVQLDRVELDDFNHDDDYRKWRWDAITALGYFICERDYIAHWLTDNELIPVEKAPAPVSESPQLMAIRIRQRIADIAEQLDRGYQAVYSGSRLPNNTAEARKRLKFVTNYREKVDRQINVANELCHFSDVYISTTTKIKAPLHALLNKIEGERQIIKAYLRPFTSSSSQDAHGSSPEIICAIALTRAEKEGFHLSETEVAALDCLSRDNTRIAS